ncbi:MAG TPA: flagellar FliJ family protein [Verrucomicrobiae bacterium]|nr:flagellar FliJ family protein [Verrucomicrobiae bacterium]
MRLRRGQERAERLKLEAIASERARARRQLEIMTEQFFESRRRFQQLMVQGTSGSELQFENARSESVAAARLALKARISELDQQRLKQVEVYMKARQSREILDNLRNTKFEVYRQMLSRREQQELDALFLMRQDPFREE